MATLKHEHSINEEEIYFNFINSMKSEVTKKLMKEVLIYLCSSVG